MTQFGIYKWTNLVTGRVLVGQTGSTVGFKKRKSNYVSQLRRGVYGNKHFQSSWTKHGEASFEWSVIELHDSDLKLTEREQHWVNFHRAVPTGVFNETGPVENSRRGTRNSLEHNAKVSAANKGKKQTTEAKKMMSLARSGVPQSAEHAEKRAVGARKSLERVVILTGEIKTYASLVEAGQDGFSESAISGVCHGRHHSHAGFYWRFAERPNPAVVR